MKSSVMVDVPDLLIKNADVSNPMSCPGALTLKKVAQELTNYPVDYVMWGTSRGVIFTKAKEIHIGSYRDGIPVDMMQIGAATTVELRFIEEYSRRIRYDRD